MPKKPTSARRTLLVTYLSASALLLVGFLLWLAGIALGWRQGDFREIVLDALRAELALSRVFAVIFLSAELLMLRDAIVARWKGSVAEGESQPPRGRH